MALSILSLGMFSILLIYLSISYPSIGLRILILDGLGFENLILSVVFVQVGESLLVLTDLELADTCIEESGVTCVRTVQQPLPS